AVGELDEVHAVLALPAHLGDHLVARIAEHANAVIGRADPGRLVVLDAPVGDDHAPGAMHARAFHQAEPDRVAHTDIRKPRSARHTDAGHARAQYFLRAPCRLQRTEFRPDDAAAAALALQVGIAVREMAMCVDQARHDPLAGRVDHLDVLAVLEAHV